MHQHHEFRDDVFYEPRALWDIADVQAGARQATRANVPTAAESRVLLDTNNFRNRGRHTLVLTHVLISGIGYMLMQNPNGQAAGITTYNNATDVMNRCQVFVSAPGRAHMSQRDLLLNAWSQEPTGVVAGTLSPNPYVSSLRGLSRWDFDFPFWLPNKGRVEFDMSTWGHPGGFGAGTFGTDIRYAMGFSETPVRRGSYKTGNAERMPGTFRYRGQPYGQTALPALQPAGDAAVWPAGRNPFAADGFGVIGTAVVQGGSFTMWNHGIPATLWDEQEADRGASHKEIGGFAVMIDQIDYDERIQNSGVLAAVGQQVTPLQHKVATRAKCTNGGSNEWWWRPGCPLSLVSPTIGQALVHKLDDPFVLGKGDSLSVEVQVPLLSEILQAMQATPPTYHLGVSFCGYAMIEG